MDEHKKFLADRLLSEERPITYRLLSRALDVHVNTAKEMLFDFHKYQNALRTESVHATYLVYGVKDARTIQGDGDVEMASSAPENETLSDEVLTETLTLVGEEKLNDILKEYQQITSIHVYSLAPHPQRDLALLSNIAKSMSEFKAEADTAVACKKYGTIFNAHVRRRDRKSRPTAVPAAASKAGKQESKPVKQEPIPVQPAAAAKVKQEASSQASTPNEATPSAASTGKKPPTLKKGGSGSIMQSFARAAAKPPKPKPAVKKEDDAAMALSDDGEADDSDVVVSKKEATDADATRKSRKQREEDLRRMMEEDDDEADEDDKDGEPDDEEMEEAQEPEPEPELEAPAEAEAPSKSSEASEPAEVISSTDGGRRRGKRRIMKKKRILDDQGYMVTIQEPGWESFSEDDAAPPAKKPNLTSMPSSSAAIKAKKPAAKGSSQGTQGSIMSFFSKK